MEVGRRIWTSLLPLSLVFTLLFASSPLASTGDMQRDYVKYVLQVERSMVIEGVVVDNNGQGIENASITGWIHSEIIPINVNTNKNGYFRIVLPGGENHEYSLNINENHFGYNTDHPYRGFDNCTIENTIKSGEHHRLRISLNYNPFDVELEETSGSLTRGWTPYSHSYTVEDKELTGYTYEQFVGYDASVPKYRIEQYVSHYEPVYRTEMYVHHYATGVYYTTESVPHTGVYYTYEWITYYYYGHFYMYQISVPHYYTYYTYVSVPHYYQYAVYAYREVFDHYEPVYAYRTVTRQVLDHYEPVYAYRLMQDGYRNIRVPSYTQKWRITVEEWDWWGLMYNGTRTFTVTTEAEAAGYWVGKTYSWGLAGSGNVISKEMIYTLSNGQTTTSQPSAVWEAKISPTEPARSDSIRDVRANYKITTTRYSVTNYSPQPWDNRQTTITATPNNGYQGDVRLVVEADSIQATLGSTRLTFSSLAQTTLTMRPHSITSGSPHSVTIKARDPNGRLVKTRTYDLTLNSNKPAAYTTSSTSYRDAWDEVPSYVPPELPEPPKVPDFIAEVNPTSGRITNASYESMRVAAVLIIYNRGGPGKATLTYEIKGFDKHAGFISVNLSSNQISVPGMSAGAYGKSIVPITIELWDYSHFREESGQVIISVYNGSQIQAKATFYLIVRTTFNMM